MLHWGTGGRSARVRPSELFLTFNRRSIPGARQTAQLQTEEKAISTKVCRGIGKVQIFEASGTYRVGLGPFIVPEKHTAMYHRMFDYHQINMPTKENRWPMPHIDAVIEDAYKAGKFVTINFTLGY